MVTVNKPNSPVDQSEELLNKLLAVLTSTAPPPARAPDLSPLDKLVQLLLSETAKREPADGVRNIAANVLHRAAITKAGAQVRTSMT